MSSKKTHNFIHVLKKSQKICFTKMKIATQFSAIKNRQCYYFGKPFRYIKQCQNFNSWFFKCQIFSWLISILASGKALFLNKLLVFTVHTHPNSLGLFLRSNGRVSITKSVTRGHFIFIKDSNLLLLHYQTLIMWLF